MAKKIENLKADLRNKLVAGVMGERKAREALIAAIRAAGTDHPDTKATVMATRMAMHPDCFPGANGPVKDLIGKARILLTRANAKSEAADRRTEGQERAYGTARQYWSELLRAAGVATSETRGGANNPTGASGTDVVDPAPAKKNGKTHAGQGKATTVADPTPAKQATPGAANPVEAHAYLEQLVAMAKQYTKKNGSHMTVKQRQVATLFASLVNAAKPDADAKGGDVAH